MVDLNLGDSAAIIAEARARGVLRNQLAYILATAKWETAHTIKPIREAKGTSTEDTIARLDRAWARGQLPWVSKAYWRDGFFGRGYIQLTHRSNYERAQRELALGNLLTEDPDAAMRPAIARQVIVVGMLEGWFTGKKLSDYVTIERSDFVNARRIVNGMDKAHEIAALAQEYDSALIEAGYGVVSHPDPAEAPAPWFESILAALAALFAKWGKK